MKDVKLPDGVAFVCDADVKDFGGGFGESTFLFCKYGEHTIPLFTADQMRQFREEGVREALELAKQMFKSGLEHAAVYVEDHCQDGEFHAEQISNFPLPTILSQDIEKN